jgi:RNA 3'-terminal phosphate cyclase (ATP)
VREGLTQSLVIDGSEGEGGGQVLRSSLALSLVTRTPIRIVRIRAKRKKPGLQAQHLAAVRACAEIGHAELSGATVGSTAIMFTPGETRHAEYAFTIGTAGSTTLVLQAVLPALLSVAGRSVITIDGGTHNPMAPSVDFLSRAFVPLVARMGATIDVRLERAGFYPGGGGRIHATIVSEGRLAPLVLDDRGPVKKLSARAVVAGGLPASIADRELTVVRDRLPTLHDRRREILTDAGGPGNFLTIDVESEHVTEVFTGLGERGVRAEDVATRACDEAARYLAAGVPVGEHLADQLLLPLALAGGRGSFVTSTPTPHTTTQLDVIRRFLPSLPIRCERLDAARCRVIVG